MARRKLSYSGRTRRGNRKKTTYVPTRGASKKIVRVHKRNGKLLTITVTKRTTGRKRTTRRRRR